MVMCIHPHGCCRAKFSRCRLAFCNKLFFLEQLYKKLPSEERKIKWMEKEPEVWKRFWTWLDGLEPSGGSKLEKAVNLPGTIRRC